MNPRRIDRLSPMRLVPAGLAATALFLSACGNNNDPTEFSEAFTAPDASGMTYEIVIGSDAATAASADQSACGGVSNEEYSTDKHLDVMSSAENSDLLASKENRLVEIIGPNAVKLLAERSIVLAEDAPLTEGLSAYQMMIAKSVPLQLSPETVAKNPLRANFMCVDTDGSGIGDRVQFANLATTENEDGSPIDLVSVVVSMEDYNDVIAASSADGLDFESKLITQPIFIEVKNADGSVEIVEMMVVFFADNDCLNPAEKTHIKPRKDIVPTTVGTIDTTIPSDTNPPTTPVAPTTPTTPTTQPAPSSSTTVGTNPTTTSAPPPPPPPPTTMRPSTTSTTGRKGESATTQAAPPTTEQRPSTTVRPSPTTAAPNTLPPGVVPSTHEYEPEPVVAQPTDAAPVNGPTTSTSQPAHTIAVAPPSTFAVGPMVEPNR